jgi:hypothetical protein
MTKIWGSNIHVYLPSSKNNPVQAGAGGSTDTPVDMAVPVASTSASASSSAAQTPIHRDRARYQWVKSFKGFAVAKKIKGDTANSSTPTPLANNGVRLPQHSNLVDLLKHSNVVHSSGKSSLGTHRLKSDLQRILGRYDANILRESPMVDAKGTPFRLALASGARPKREANAAYNRSEPNNDIRMTEVAAWIDSYKERCVWQNGHMHVRKIRHSDVESYESALVNQEGVFSRKSLEHGTVVGPFGGIVLDNGAESYYRELCRAAGMDSDKYSFLVTPSGNTDRRLVGQSMLMKANTAFLAEPAKKKFVLNEHDDRKNNISLFFVDVQSDTGETFALGFFYANREIAAEEQLCYKYGSKDTFTGE